MSEQLLAEARSRLEELLAPISGGVGEDPSYDEKYDQLKTEGDKLSSLSGEQVNWGNIAALGRELLTDKAKDFRVACYLAAALVITDGPRGLLDSLVCSAGTRTRRAPWPWTSSSRPRTAPWWPRSRG
ncbi:MAG: type VI secretion system ImpA family N-terminal domain-containing protein [Deltaproteobacteria bacterium]|nr:type VI secretion system ImpA family N-terminal domain-containing protein [Deltaproteobacteria bacterium]